MNISIFDVTGPIMIGPSSSHTAGAARLARIAGIIAAKPFTHVSFGLHGSFAKTYKGHGTDIALVAGALGIREDDENLIGALEAAKERGISYDVYEAYMENVHENTVKMDFTLQDGGSCQVVGSSVGGGRVIITEINGYQVEMNDSSPTLLIHQIDRVGAISEITHILSEKNINIAVMKLSRSYKGGDAFCMIETDAFISEDIAEKINALPQIISVQAVNL